LIRQYVPMITLLTIFQHGVWELVRGEYIQVLSCVKTVNNNL